MNPSTIEQKNQEEDNKTNIPFLLQAYLPEESYPQTLIKQISLKIFPVQESNNVYMALSKALHRYIQTQQTKGQEYSTIINNIYDIASLINREAAINLKTIFSEEEVKKKFTITPNKTKTPHSVLLGILNEVPTKSSVGTKKRREFDFNPYKQTMKKQEKEEISPAVIASRYMKEKSNNAVNNLCLEKYRCICEEQVEPSEDPLDEKNIFKCISCEGYYHKKCMNRKKYCSFCHMKKMFPLKIVQKDIFVGVLNAFQYRHEITFNIKESIKGRFFQLRSMRIKDEPKGLTNHLTLFPDACTITINNHLVKQYQPLHRQSSLKYRRDDTLNISSHLVQGQNKIVVNERSEHTKKKEWKDERIEKQTHIIGVYMITLSSVDRVINEATLNCLQFNQSKQLLDNSFLIQEDVACQNVRLPLVCSLTLQLLKFPARTVFCEHFSCFDLKNFLLLNGKADIPKWLCPICKEPAHDFRIDPIFKCIIDNLEKTKMEGKQIDFGTHGDYRILIGSEVGERKSIYDLPIQSKYKRFDENRENINNPRKRRKNQKFELPSNCEVFEISQ